MTVKFLKVCGSTKNDGTNHTPGSELFAGFTALTHAPFRLLALNVHDSPANVDTSMRPLYVIWLVLFAYVLMYVCSGCTSAAAEHGSEDMSNERKSLNGEVIEAVVLVEFVETVVLSFALYWPAAA